MALPKQRPIDYFDGLFCFFQQFLLAAFVLMVVAFAHVFVDFVPHEEFLNVAKVVEVQHGFVEMPPGVERYVVGFQFRRGLPQKGTHGQVGFPRGFEDTLPRVRHKKAAFAGKALLVYPFLQGFPDFGMKGDDPDPGARFASGNTEKMYVPPGDDIIRGEVLYLAVPQPRGVNKRTEQIGSFIVPLFPKNPRKLFHGVAAPNLVVHGSQGDYVLYDIPLDHAGHKEMAEDGLDPAHLPVD